MPIPIVARHHRSRISRGSPPPRAPNGFRASYTPPRRSLSAPIPIGASARLDFHNIDADELWAGSTFNNSPPPSSLPIPAIFLLRRHSALSSSDSAPSSPSSFCSDESSVDAFATRDLCRILNLDVGF